MLNGLSLSLRLLFLLLYLFLVVLLLIVVLVLVLLLIVVVLVIVFVVLLLFFALYAILDIVNIFVGNCTSFASSSSTDNALLVAFFALITSSSSIRSTFSTNNFASIFIIISFFGFSFSASCAYCATFFARSNAIMTLSEGTNAFLDATATSSFTCVTCVRSEINLFIRSARSIIVLYKVIFTKSASSAKSNNNFIHTMLIKNFFERTIIVISIARIKDRKCYTIKVILILLQSFAV
jgi:hypothetical protein